MDTELLFPHVLPETYDLARKAAILAAEDQPIDSNIETDYDKPRKRQLPARFTETSDDDDFELKNAHTKRKRQVAGGSCREMRERMENENQNCQYVSQKRSIPSPAASIKEQLAALKTQVSPSKKASKSKGFYSNTKKKILSVKKVMKAVNSKVSPRKSPLKGKK